MQQAFFITGTDTNAGKTYVACQLIHEYIALGYKVVGMKPVAAGCELVNGEWVNDDVLKLEAASNVAAPRALINPYSFNEPVAPHIAAQKVGVTININIIKQAFDALTKLADIVIVEGAGGFLVPLNIAPLNDAESMANLAIALNIPVILVVGMKLGCINHSLLTAEAIKARGLHLHGWVANHIDPNMAVAAENLSTISQLLGASSLKNYAYKP